MHSTEPSHATLPVDAEALWRVLTDDGFFYVWVIDENGVVRYANESAARFYLDRSAQEVAGQHLSDLFPMTFSPERLDILRTALESPRPIRFPTHWAGQWLYASIWPVHRPCRGALVLVRHAFQQSMLADIPVLSLWEQNNQPLASLSPTERLVLAGIGEGWSTSEIARRMHRSTKTVEWHRNALGRRLACRSRVELARIALLAGLSWKQALAMCDNRYDGAS